MSSAENIQRSKYLAMIREYGLALKRAQDATMMGQPLDPQTQALLSDHTYEELFKNLTSLGNAAATRGVGAYDPNVQLEAPGPTVQDVMREFNLR